MRVLIIHFFLLLGLFFPALASASTSLNLSTGWNLLGNSSSSPISMATFGDATKITTVWKWNKTASKWAFYAPAMTSSALTAYAQGKGYDVLTSIDPKEGFWVNASTAVALTGPAASGVTLAASDLLQGWNLESSADNKTPSELNASLSSSLIAAGKAITTTWAWDAPNTKWKFYAPSLEANGSLANYITGKGYLPFSSALPASDGFWLNIGAVTPTPKSNIPRMHAVHMEGNWGGNVDGIKSIPDAYIQRLKADHVDYVAITLPVFSTSISDPAIQIRYRPSNSTNYAVMYSFDDADLINAITKLKQNGINVYMSIAILQSQSGAQSGTCNTAQYEVDPHLLGDPQLPNATNSSGFEYQCIDPSLWWWNPSDPRYAANVATFWSTYTQVVVHYAQMAQQLGVGMLGLGEESDRLFTTRSSSRFPSNYRNQLSQMVTSVRAVYTGLLTYGQNGVMYSDHPEWWGYDFTASGSLFQDLGLDVVGLSYYFTLIPSTVTTVLSVAQLETAWNTNFQKTLGLAQISNPNIPIVFSSTGTTDSVNAPNQPLDQSGAPYIFSDLNNNGIDDGMEQQANIYQALFNVNKSNNNLVSGFFCWGYIIDTNPYIFAANNSTRNSELHSRPAEQIISSTYSTF